MKKVGYLLLLCLVSGQLLAQKAERLINYVEPMVGTANSTTLSALKHGEGGEQNANTIPAVGVPFGMTQWSAQTHASEQKCVPPYYYKETIFSGIRATHWMSGSCTQDYGSFTIMPITGKLKTKLGDYAMPFAHTDEVAGPDYYRINLSKYNLAAEVTSTARCGIMRFTVSRDDSLYLLVVPNSDKAKGYVKIDRAHNEIVAYNPAYRVYQGAGKPAGFNGYMVMKIERQAGNSGTFNDEQTFAMDSIANQKNIGAYLGFKVKAGEKLVVRMGTSFTSLAEARKNLAKEIPDYNFDAVRLKASQTWEKALHKIEIKTTPKNKRIFYTAMYHTMQLPRLYNDADGTYPQFAHEYQTAQLQAGKNYYCDYSMWDIYRAELPLYEILDTKLTGNLVNSLIIKGDQGGFMPVFPCWDNYTNEMIGDHGAVYIASAYLRGIKGYDIKEAYRLMRQNAFVTPAEDAYADGKGRRALDDYIKYGFIPLENPVKHAYHSNEQVSRTLEYAYDDYALAMVAKSLDKPVDYQILIKRSANYKNVFDRSIGFVRGKHTDGTWAANFNADAKAPYITEGTARQYTFYVPQDVPGLTRLMGGKAKLELELDSLFITGEYWHGNEPGHQIPFMYNFTDNPGKTQLAVRKILAEEYTDGPGGLSGNDDAGQISAWYVFGAMGFYPVDPVSGRYELCSPVFDNAVIHLPNGKQFTVVTHKGDGKSVYIRSAMLNGKKYLKTYITYTDINNGGKLEVWL